MGENQTRVFQFLTHPLNPDLFPHPMNEMSWDKPLLTVTNFNIFECQLRAGVADQHLPVERKHDVVVDEVYHAADHIAWLPLAAKGLTAHVPALALQGDTGKGVTPQKGLIERV